MFPGECLEWQRTASTLWFVNSIFCEVKYEREENYKESGMFS